MLKSHRPAAVQLLGRVLAARLRFPTVVRRVAAERVDGLAAVFFGLLAGIYIDILAPHNATYICEKEMVD